MRTLKAIAPSCLPRDREGKQLPQRKETAGLHGCPLQFAIRNVPLHTLNDLVITNSQQPCTHGNQCVNKSFLSLVLSHSQGWL